ncbi:MAG: TonB family protein [Bacteroidetes bacterium]|nr:TonB family protein [Bacteroidota bacterium]
MTIKIMKKTTISDEEIQGFMDFEGLMKKNAVATRSSSITRWVLTTAGLIILAVGTWQYWNNQSKKTSAPTKEILPKKESITPLPATSERKEEKQKNEAPPVSRKPAPPLTQTLPAKEKPTMTVTAAEYHEAEPAAGFPALYEYLNHEIVYPKSMLKDSIEGVESVSFIIDENGKPGQIKVLQSLGKTFDEEATRLISGMPLWKPATLDGKPVASKITLPLTFSFTRAKK